MFNTRTIASLMVTAIVGIIFVAYVLIPIVMPIIADYDTGGQYASFEFSSIIVTLLGIIGVIAIIGILVGVATGALGRGDE